MPRRWAPLAFLAPLLPLGRAALRPVPAAAQQASPAITRGPYLQEATASSVAVLWRTDAPAAGAVDVRVAAGALSARPPTTTPSGTPAASASATTEWRTVGSAGSTRDHAIVLTDLEPATAYEYRVRLDGSTAPAATSAFTTLPPTEEESLDFVFMADNQTGHVPHAEVVARILAERPLPSLVLHGGDQCENGSRPEQWDQWFRVERDLMARVPLFPCLGNHEENSPLYFQNFRVPGNGTASGRGRWYSFDAGPAHFIALDVVYSDVEPGSPQFRWLEQDLARTDRPYKFVYFHYPPYNASPHHRSNLRLRAALEPLFLRHKVSAVFNGHGHLYERAFGGAANPEAPPLTWFVAGGGGGVPQPIGREPFTQYTEVTYHFLRVRIRGGRLTTTGVKPDGTEFDPFEARLDGEGRLLPTGPRTAAIAIPEAGVPEFAASIRGQLFFGYQALMGVLTPLAASFALPSRRRGVIPVPSGPVHVPLTLPEDPHTGWRGLPVVGMAGAAALLVALVVLPTAPLQWLFGFDAYTIVLSVHALVGTLLLLVSAYAAYAGYWLATRRAPSLRWMAAVAAVAAGLAAVSAVLGDGLYAAYVKSGGPVEEIVKKAPDAHILLFEFKARLGMVPLPLSVAAAFITWRYGSDLRRDRHLAELVALVLMLLALAVLVPFGLGAVVTRLRGIL